MKDDGKFTYRAAWLALGVWCAIVWAIAIDLLWVLLRGLP